MTVYAITDTKNGEQGYAPTYLQTTQYKFNTKWQATKKASVHRAKK